MRFKFETSGNAIETKGSGRAFPTCSQRHYANGRLSTDQFVADSLQYSQYPAHRPIAPTDQHPEPGDVPERVQAKPEPETGNTTLQRFSLPVCVPQFYYTLILHANTTR